MFDFLGEAKRQILLRHPVLGVLSPYPQALKKFLENLKYFESDLKSKISEKGPKRPEEVFTEEDIERVRNYANLLLSDVFMEMILLSQRILKEAAFDLWNHCGEAKEMNDWVRDDYYYTRAIHNYQENVYRWLLEDRDTAQNNFVLPLNLLVCSRMQEPFQIKVKKPSHSAISPIPNHWWLSSFRNEDPFYEGRTGSESLHDRFHHFNHIFPFYLRCAIFCMEHEYEYKKMQAGVQRINVKEPVPYLGWLGIKRTRQADKPYFKEIKIFKHRNSTLAMLGGFVNSTTNLIVEFRLCSKTTYYDCDKQHATLL